MRLTGGGVLRLFLALTLFVSFLIRPPGTMLSLDGDKISYILCTGGEPEIVEVPLDGEADQEIDLGCEFFAAQVALLGIGAPDNQLAVFKTNRVDLVTHIAIAERRTMWHPHTARAPPVVS